MVAVRIGLITASDLRIVSTVRDAVIVLTIVIAIVGVYVVFGVFGVFDVLDVIVSTVRVAVIFLIL